MRRGLTFAALLALAPSFASAAPEPMTWFGFTIGTPVAPYRATMGDPLIVTSSAASVPPSGSDRIERKARFLVSKTGNVFGIVFEGHGTVSALEMFAAPVASAPRTDLPPDPNGVYLGEDEATLAAHLPGAEHEGAVFRRADDERNLWSQYQIVDGRVADIFWYTRGDHGAAPGPHSYAARAGESNLSAILDIQPTTADSTLWQQYYFSLHPCDGAKGAWRGETIEVKRDATRVYDDDTMVCSTSGAKREFWFDITASAGKN